MRKTSSSPLASPAGRIAAVTVIGFMTCMPGCSLDRSFATAPMGTYYQYALYATVRSADGLERPVGFEDRVLRPDTDPAYASLLEQDGSAEATDAAALDWWARYLSFRLDAGGGEEFRRYFGTGPWCLVGAPVVERVGGPLMGAAWESIPLVADPLPACSDPPPPPPPGCELAPGEEPRLALAPAELDFGSVPVDTPTGDLTVRVTNTGSGRLCLAVASPGGRHPQDFELDSPPALPLDCQADTAAEAAAGRIFLIPGESCDLRLRFRPSGHGPRLARLAVSSNAATGRTSVVDLRGTGQGGVLSVVPASPVCVPTVGACLSRRVSLRNDGPGRVRVTSWAGDGAWDVSDFLLDDAVPVTPGLDGPLLSSGGTLSATVTSCPAGFGPSGGHLSVAGNAANTPLTIEVLPAGSGPCSP